MLVMAMNTNRFTKLTRRWTGVREGWICWWYTRRWIDSIGGWRLTLRHSSHLNSSSRSCNGMTWMASAGILLCYCRLRFWPLNRRRGHATCSMAIWSWWWRWRSFPWGNVFWIQHRRRSWLIILACLQQSVTQKINYIYIYKTRRI